MSSDVVGGLFAFQGVFVPDDAAVIDQPVAASPEVAESQSAAPQAPSREAVAAAFADFDKVFSNPSERSSDEQKAPRNGAPSTEATAATGDTPDGDEGESDADTTTTTAEGQPEKKPSRTARIHAEWEAKVQAVETERQEIAARAEALQRQLDEATGKVSESEQARRANDAAFQAIHGDEAEFQRRTRIANQMFDPNYTGPQLTNDEALELARWTVTREHAEPLRNLYLGEARQMVERANEDARQRVLEAGQQFQQYIAAETISRAERYGLDPEVIKSAEYGGLIDHAVAVTTKRLTERHTTELRERDDKISQLEADLRAAEHAGLADRTELLPGGNSADVRVTARSVFDPKAPLDRQWDAAFGQRPQSVR